MSHVNLHSVPPLSPTRFALNAFLIITRVLFLYKIIKTEPYNTKFRFLGFEFIC